MKINPVSLKIVSNSIKIISNTRKNANIPYKTIELSNFNTLGRSLVSFKSLYPDDENKEDSTFDLNAMSIQQLIVLKEMYKYDASEQEEKKKDAQAKLDKIKNWDYSTEYRKQSDAAALEINEKNLSTFWNPFQCRDIKSNHYNEFQRKNREIETLKSQKSLYEQIVKISGSDVKKSKTFVSQIDVMIAQKLQIEKQEQRLESLEGINKAIEAMGNAQGGLDDRIAGYEYEKDELRRLFINPLSQSQKDPSIEVPPAVLLYGANGTGKTTFLNGIATEAKKEDYAVVESLPPVDSAKEFKEAIARIFHKAKVRYLEPGEGNKPKRVRTVLLINDAERFFGMSYNQAKAVYGNLIDETDETKLKGIKHEPELIDLFKSIFDTCSGVPEKIDHSYDNSATTIFITTNYPHLIDRDLLRKIDFFAINPAKGKNMEEVLKFYFKKCSDVLETIKERAKSPDFDPDDLKYIKRHISNESLSKLKQMAQDGTLQDLKIPYDSIPYENIAKDFRPNIKTGAFDNRQFRKLSIEALNKYIQDPSRDYSGHYYELLFNARRMLDPVRYKHQIDIFNTLAPLNKQEQKEDGQKLLDEKIMLYRMEKAGILSNKDAKKLDYIKTQDSQELKYLETKKEETSLTDEEQLRLERIIKEQKIIEEELSKLGSDIEDDSDF